MEFHQKPHDLSPLEPKPESANNSAKKTLVISLSIAVILSAAVAGAAGYFVGNNMKDKNTNNSTANTTTTVPTTTKAIATTTPASSTSPTPSVVVTTGPINKKNPVAGKSDTDIKTLIQQTLKFNSVNMIEVSPLNPAIIAYTASNPNEQKYGIYDFSTSKDTPIITFKTDILGRGGSYTDKKEIKFSPNGTNIFFTDTQSLDGEPWSNLVIASTKGTVLYQVKRLGHAAWLDNNRVLFIDGIVKNPQIYNLTSKKVEKTALPENLMHFTTNSSHKYLVAKFQSDNTQIGCEKYKYFVYDTATLKELYTIKDAEIPSTWLSENKFTYEKINNCQKYAEPAMYDYFPNSTLEIFNL